MIDINTLYNLYWKIIIPIQYCIVFFLFSLFYKCHYIKIGDTPQILLCCYCFCITSYKFT